MNRQASAIQLLGLERERAEKILAPYEIVSAEKAEAKDQRREYLPGTG